MKNLVSINKDTLTFLSQIEDNNNKIWFEENRKRWDIVKENYISFMESLQSNIIELDNIIVKEPKKYMSRIHRDLRFARDKSPFRDYLWSLIERDENGMKSIFYLQISPGDCFVASGLWSPDVEAQRKIRQEINYNSEQLHKIIYRPSFKNYFGTLMNDSLVRPPKGYDVHNPNIELLKLRKFMVKKNFSDDIALSSYFVNEIMYAYKEAMPFMRFLDTAVIE